MTIKKKKKIKKYNKNIVFKKKKICYMLSI